MHMAGISGVVSRAAKASHQQRQQPHQKLRNNGVPGLHNYYNNNNNKPAGVHNSPETRPKNAITTNGTVDPPRSIDKNRASSGGLSGMPGGSMADFRGSMPRLNVTGQETKPQMEHRSRQMSAYRRWLSRNKVAPGTAMNINKQNGGHRMSGTFHQQQKYREGQKYRETLGASVLLYMGIGMIVVGLVITFVGIGDHAFHTLELQLIGPTVIAVGLVVCGIRILICAFANKCDWCDRRIDDEDGDGDDDPDHDVHVLRAKSNVSYLGSARSWRLQSSSTTNLMRTPVMMAADSTDVITFPRAKSSVTTMTSSSASSKHLRNNSEDELVAAELARQSSSTTSIPSSLLFSPNVTPQPRHFSAVHTHRPSSSSSSSSSSFSSDFQEIQFMSAPCEDGDNFKSKNGIEISGVDESRVKSAPIGSVAGYTDDDDVGRLHRLRNGVVLNPSSLKS